jgi:hypothetical protein
MPTKFQRNYRLEVQGKDERIYTFNYPMTLEFNIQRAALASTNTASLRIYNLNPDTRKAIYKDIYDNIVGSFRSVRLNAGYGDSLSQILYGNIKEAKSFREEGSVNFITEIDCYDWSTVMMNTRSEWIKEAPLPLTRLSVVNQLVDDLVASSPSGAKLSKGAISTGFTDQPYARNFFKASGTTWEILRQETNDHCFIDNGVVHCLLDDDCFTGDLPIINSSTGLLSTPKKSEYLLKIDILFEPALKIGQMVQLVSESETLYNGSYKIIGIQHYGVISGAVGGKCKTTLLLNAGEFELSVITGQVINSPAPLNV